MEPQQLFRLVGVGLNFFEPEDLYAQPGLFRVTLDSVTL